MRDPGIYLKHILASIERIEEYTKPGKERFLTSHLLQNAVLHVLQTMAESTQRLPQTMKAMMPEIDWVRIAAFRNVIAHEYLGVDLEVVWTITQRELPELRNAISTLMTQQGPGAA